MRIYELALTISGSFSEDKVKEVITKISDFIKLEKGKVTKTDTWGKRALAYSISKEKEASFLFLSFEAPFLSKGFNQKVKLTEGVLRYLLLRKK